MNRIPSVLLLASLAAAAAPASAQDLRYLRRTGGYWAIGLAGGNLELTCDSGCAGGRLSSNGATLNLGRHFGDRVRLDLGVQYQNNSETSSNASAISAGVAVYLVGNLHVRGGASWLRVSVGDTAGSTDGSGGPGFLVGAGYDIHLGRRLALTPYVNYTSGSISTLERTAPGGLTGTTSGSLRALNVGAALSFMGGTWECINAAGERVRVTRGNRTRALACLREVEVRLGRRPSSIKY